MIATFKPLPETSHFGSALIPVATDGPGPAFVMAWTGTDGQAKLNSSYSNTGGTTWNKTLVRQTGPSRLGATPSDWESSAAAPALTMHNNKLFLCWTDSDQQRLQLMSSSDHGRTWHNKRAIAEESSIAAPAIASYEGLLVVAWTGTDGAGTLCVATSDNEGRTWNKVTLPEWSVAGPSLTWYSSDAGFPYLFLGFTGTDHALRVRWCQSLNFAEFSKPGYQIQVLGETSDNGPSLSVLNQGEGKDISLAVAWTGTDDRQLHVSYSLQGFSPFSPKTTAPDDTSGAAPALITYRNFPAENDLLVLTWTDQNSHLNFGGADKLF